MPTDESLEVTRDPCDLCQQLRHVYIALSCNMIFISANLFQRFLTHIIETSAMFRHSGNEYIHSQ